MRSAASAVSGTSRAPDRVMPWEIRRSVASATVDNEETKTVKLIQKMGRIALAATCLLSGAALHAEEGPWMIRVRALLIDPDNKSDAIPSLAVPSNAVEVDSRWVPELDISYFFNKSLAAELVLAYTKLDVKVRDSAIGAFDAGSFYALPPSLLLQWHFLPEGSIRPYVGAGINYTHISRVKLAVPGVLPLYLESSSVGPALQAGVDFKLDGPWSLNFDIKKAWIESDIRTGA
ncbi:MAG: OmpW family outer membrane protein, partial [Methylibium sp.]|nr:OmpW family outer membrane protein [Methylibium sp.]